MSPMKKQPRHPEPPTYARLVFRDNVETLMRYRFRDEDNQPLALAKAAGVTLSSVQRVLSGNTNTKVDTVSKLADAFGLSVYQMFLPELDPRNPLMIKGLTRDERQFYDKLRRDFQAIEK